MAIEKTISIIIPVYGTEPFFERCIKSVIHQSYKNIEIIVVNDGTPGNLDDLIQPYLCDKRVKYIRHEKNQGLFRARVTGMRNATGEFCAFLDCDDYVSLDFYRPLIANAEENNSDIVIGKTVWKNEDGCYIYNLHEAALSFNVLTDANEVKERYFSQEAMCYSWHTIWNKIYSKKLIDKCLPIFERNHHHIVMTEDIGFSSVFFYEAKIVSRVEEGAYFYCENTISSTNVTKISIERFVKNIDDMIAVFEMVDRYLLEKRATDETISHFHNARIHYARMWQHLLNTSFDNSERSIGQSKLSQFCSEFSMDHIETDYFFESIRTPWNGAFEYIKQQISDSSDEYVSFDIFDTLIIRPFYCPEDIFSLLNIEYHKLTNSSASFAKMRTHGEAVARRRIGEVNPEYQDVTLSEIYQSIGDIFNLDYEIVNHMKNEEIRLEIKFSELRKSGKSIYELAKSVGKKIILVSDMYLERPTIEAILKKHNIDGFIALFISSEYRLLKKDGYLFERVKYEIPEVTDNIVHIGDSWVSDIVGSQAAGIKSIFYPKVKDLFEGNIHDYCTNRCSNIGENTLGTMRDNKAVCESVAINSMKAIVANKYFDYAYRSFNDTSDLNADPYYIGYYVVGMHMLGLAKWIYEQVNSRKYRTLHFLARDGYLPMKAYQIYTRSIGKKVKSAYIETSRKALMPYIAENVNNFYQLPIEYKAYTPRTLFRLLDFAARDITEQEIEDICRESKIEYDSPFANESSYFDAIRVFIEKIYSEKKHDEAKAIIEDFFSRVSQNDLMFDMGYSGRIQTAISAACRHPVDVLFVHEDYKHSTEMKNYAGYTIASFYRFVPAVSGVFREHILSKSSESCIAYQRIENNTVPLYENKQKYNSDRLVVEMIQRGAVEFIKDYTKRFRDYMINLDFSEIEASLPFEGFLRHFSGTDIEIFGSSFFEDEVWGGQSQINIRDFLTIQQDKMNENTCNFSFDTKDESINEVSMVSENDNMRSEPTFIDVLNCKSKAQRAIIWIVVNPPEFVNKVKINLNRVLKAIKARIIRQK